MTTSMPVSPQQFTYTTNRTMFRSALLTLCMLFLVEGGVIVLLMLLFIPGLLLKLLSLTAFITFIIAIFFGSFMATSRTSHLLTATALQLHFGLAFKVALPRSALASASPVRERISPFAPLIASYDAKRSRITAAFSDQGQILLNLHEPLHLKVGHRVQSVESILINVDQRDELLAALKIQTATTEKEPLSPSPLKRTFSASGLSASANTQPAISIRSLVRTFGDFVAVDQLTIAIQPGEIYGFLGSNGAGKTTTIKMLVGLLQPDSGQVIIAGNNMWQNSVAAKSHIGYVADRAILYERLTGRDFLNFIAQMRGLPLMESEQRITSLLALLDLDQHADRLCGSYSFGMKRKLSLAAALLHQPTILILDEPLNGLDPRSARRLKDLFVEQATRGTAIMLSTHDLATAQEVCHRVGIIHKGRLLAEGSATELRTVLATPSLEAAFLTLTEEAREVAL